MDLVNPFDIGITVILAFCLIRGFFRGFIKEVFSLIGIVGGFYGACSYYPAVGRMLARWVIHLPYLNMVAFLLLFFGIFILISLLGTAARYVINIVFLKWVDRCCGLVFGAVKGVLITSILLMALTTFLPECQRLIQNSHLAPKVVQVSEKLASFVPKEMKRDFAAKLEECRKAWKSSR